MKNEHAIEAIRHLMKFWELHRLDCVDCEALSAGAAALDAITPRRITSDPATWPEEGVYVWAFHVEVGWTKAKRAYEHMVRETYSMMGGIPIREFSHWLPMPPKPE